jgi:hypothetical protein
MPAPLMRLPRPLFLRFHGGKKLADGARTPVVVLLLPMVSECTPKPSRGGAELAH